VAAALCLGLLVYPSFRGAAVAGEAGASVTVDLSEPGAPISPYLYGQFIEHLGRCIYGGIWAEMLRDRKFLLEVGKSWEVIKPKDAVFDACHDPAGAYGGEHCLALWVRDARGGKCGIRQGGIGLVAGKEYTGYAVLAHAGAPAPVEVRLSWGAGADSGQSAILMDVGASYRKVPFRFRAGATTDAATLSLTLSSPAYLWVAGVSLMPADNVRGMRADTLALIRKLAPPITRWPGGNFVSGYRWEDGIGDRERRPPRWERAWEDVESNDFGIDEFLQFCSEVGTEPYIAVNAGLGSVEEAAAEVEYANGAAASRWGAVRARNGHPEPYGVVWWGVGNEMYGNWQLGNVPVERYAIRHNAFVRAMQTRDPQIKVIAVGTPGRWNDVVVAACARHMDLLSGHHYTQRKFRVPLSPADAEEYRESFAAYSGSVAAGVRGLVTDMKKRQVAEKPEAARLRLAVDEWGIVRDWKRDPDGPGIGAFEHYYTLGDAIAIGRGLHEILRSADTVAMANWAQTVNVIGLIKTSRTHAALDPGGHVFALYRVHLGGRVAAVRTAGAPALDAVAGWDPESGTLAIGLINFSPGDAVGLRLHIEGEFKAGKIEGWRISGPELGATNVPGKPEAVTTSALGPELSLSEPLTLPPHTITLLKASLASS
jgi:alpha-N-arabinofuranosidase